MLFSGFVKGTGTAAKCNKVKCSVKCTHQSLRCKNRYALIRWWSPSPGLHFIFFLHWHWETRRDGEREGENMNSTRAAINSVTGRRWNVKSICGCDSKHCWLDDYLNVPKKKKTAATPQRYPPFSCLVTCTYTYMGSGRNSICLKIIAQWSALSFCVCSLAWLGSISPIALPLWNPLWNSRGHSPLR